MTTRHNKSFYALLGAVLMCAPLCRSQANAPASDSPAIAASSIPTSNGDEKRAKAILNVLKLNDAAKETSVKTILIEHSQAQKAWHEKNDAQIKDLWNKFNKARSATNQPEADAVIAQIDQVYADFKPEHDAFIAKLATQLTPEQIETVKDVMTVNKVKVTYDNYLLIFHGLTAEQRDFILKNLKAGREEAMDAAEIKKEGSAFFKKYKIKIEAYLTAQGYDVKKSYSEFVAKQKAEMAAKKPGNAGPAEKAGKEKE